jgi:ABC-type multidrug transport system ATPase subunit
MIVIASIHQPSTNTLLLFDDVLLLSQGKTVYYGPPDASNAYFTALGHPPEHMISPAEHMLELTNVDFSRRDDRDERLESLITAWNASAEAKTLHDQIEYAKANAGHVLADYQTSKRYPRSLAMQSLIILHRMALVSPISGTH